MKSYENLEKHLDIAGEVREALEKGLPVVALESTIISHGMPYPQNVETALLVEETVRQHGAVPATIAIIGGRLKVGLTPEDVQDLIPVKPLADLQPGLLEGYRTKLNALLEKIRP